VRFLFQVAMASRDRPLLEALQQFLGFGHITDRPPGKAGWEPMSSFRISSLRGHHASTIPFAERYVLESAKRDQFEHWRDELYRWEAEHPSRWGKGRSTCAMEGCSGLVRGRGLCRSHYYRATGY
jgi:hypothetical protein